MPFFRNPDASRARVNLPIDLLKFASLCIITAIGYFTWFSDVRDILSALYALEDYRGFAVFLLLSAASLASLFLTAFLRSGYIRSIFLSVFLISIMVETMAVEIYGDNISVVIFSDLLINANEVKFGFFTYSGIVLKHAVFWTALFIPLYFRPRLFISPLFAVLPLVAMAGGYWYTSKNASLRESLPANTSVMSRLIVASLLENPDVERRRDQVDQAMMPDAAGFSNIVIIVDESVRSDYMQLNGYASDNTPFLSGRTDLINFGNAVSYANCSAGSRMAIRSMAREGDFPDPEFHVLKQPTFWQYAKRAGYKTVYIDGWLQIRPRHSFLTTDELSYVDERTSASLVPFPTSDQRIAEIVKDELKGGGKKFIFVEKIGLHAPYAMNLLHPDQLTRKFLPRPALSEEQNRLTHEYVNGIYDQVDKFFETLLDSGGLDDTVILYTSDHGQAMFDGNYEATHCTRKDTVRGEGMVPLFAFASDGELRDALAASAAAHPNRASHFDLPATMLRLMGFPVSKVRPMFGDGIFDINPSRKRQFFSGNPFLKSAVWTDVDN